MSPTHTEHEKLGWTVAIPDHPGRSESAWFRAAKGLAKKIYSTLKGTYYGTTDHSQQHHGGSLWLLDENGWFLARNVCGMEWSSQFCASPDKVDLLRQNAQRIYAGFPLTVPGMVALGYKDAADILSQPITDNRGIARWVDSIFNSCVPLVAPIHTGVLPKGAGVHHYPQPIWDIQFIKHDDFVLFVEDEDGAPVAVTPVGYRESGRAEVQVIYAHPTSKHADSIKVVEGSGQPYVLPAESPIAQQAFSKQQP